MKYAIVSLKGHQFYAKEGEELIVDRLDKKAGSKIKIGQVLLISNGKKIQIGTPTVKKAQITAKVVEHLRGEKIRVAKFKAKSRYRRVMGFRPELTKLKIEEIKDGQD
jgi:large subunit ribosomal protein L21